MPSASFGNAGAALSAYGGALKGMANKSAEAKTPLNSGSGASMSARNYRKMMNTKVEAYRQVAAIDTEHRGTRLEQSTKAAGDLKNMGFHTIEHDTPDARIKATSYGGDQMPADRAHNPSHDVHGHPGEGHVTVHGYSGDAQALPGAHQTSNVYSLPATAIKSSRVQPMALEGGKATDMGSQAGAKPATARPMFKASSTDVVKAGSFMDQPAKEQPAVAPKLKTGGAIAMGSSATKGKMKGPQLKQGDSGKLTEAGWDAKLSAQEGAELAKRKSKMKDTD
jgi:hypothetical protein